MILCNANVINLSRTLDDKSGFFTNVKKYNGILVCYGSNINVKDYCNNYVPLYLRNVTYTKKVKHIGHCSTILACFDMYHVF